MVQPLAVSTSTTVQVPPFARSCQAAHLLSRVLRHADDSDADIEFRGEEAVQLHRTVNALLSTALHESDVAIERISDPTRCIALFTSIGLCLSALFVLHNKYSCIEHASETETGNSRFQEMHMIAVSGIKDVSELVYRFSERIRAVAELGGILKTTPLIGDCLFQAVGSYLWYMHETGSQECAPMATSIKDILRKLGARWKAPSKHRGHIQSACLAQGMNSNVVLGEYILLLETYESFAGLSI